jgi:uncharacterized protein YbcI
VAIEGLYRSQFGRSTTSVYSTWSSADAVTCFLEGSLTTTERRLVAEGRERAVCNERSALHHDSAAGFCEPVESITGRTVRSFHSSMDMTVDGLADEAFLFYPVGREGPSRRGDRTNPAEQIVRGRARGPRSRRQGRHQEDPRTGWRSPAVRPQWAGGRARRARDAAELNRQMLADVTLNTLSTVAGEHAPAAQDAGNPGADRCS